MNYVYIKSEPGLWTVGFYRIDGQWEPESDHDLKEKAAERVAWLNGQKGYDTPKDERMLFGPEDNGINSTF